MKTKKVNISAAVRSVLAILQVRKEQADNELKQAVTAGQWSKLAGLHGIGVGLASAARHVASEEHSIKAPKDLAALARRFCDCARECDELRASALEHQRYGDVAAHDGLGTGWMAAKKVIEDELAPA